MRINRFFRNAKFGGKFIRELSRGLGRGFSRGLSPKLEIEIRQVSRRVECGDIRGLRMA